MNDAVISRIADAIAFAEGYFVPGSRPRRNNNPGDLQRDLTGKSVAWDGPYVVYTSATDGFDALERQVRLMFEGSHIYRPSMTIAQVAMHYTDTERSSWAQNVAVRLGVTTETRLDAIGDSNAG